MRRRILNMIFSYGKRDPRPKNNTHSHTILSMLTIAGVATLAIAMYLSFSESWPVTYLIDLQAGDDGMYSPKLTFVITWAILLAPCWLADFVIRKIKKKK
jgi:hypothetical protein